LKAFFRFNALCFRKANHGSNPVTTLAGSIDAGQESFCEIGLSRLVVNLSWEQLSEDDTATRGRLAGFAFFLWPGLRSR